MTLLKHYNTESIPYIYSDELQKVQSDYVFLDSREEKEYQTSHIKNAMQVGYDFFNLSKILEQVPDKNTKIVVYCSLGIRSESIGDRLKLAGYNQVSNLYGGIFEWKNHNYPVYNLNDKKTDSIHVFSKEWSIWSKKGIKVYE